jgi:hypothetical protein
MRIASLAVVLCACHGSAPKTSSGGPMTSHLVVAIDEGGRAKKENVDGWALAQVDEQAKTLDIVVFGADTSPAITCAWMKSNHPEPPEHASIVTLSVRDFAGKAGSYDVASVGFVKVDVDRGDMEIHGALGVTGTTIALRSFDGASFEGEIATASQDKSSLRGTVGGTVCPP